MRRLATILLLLTLLFTTMPQAQASLWPGWQSDCGVRKVIRGDHGWKKFSEYRIGHLRVIRYGHYIAPALNGRDTWTLRHVDTARCWT